jgi:WD domain, G-beta repeat
MSKPFIILDLRHHIIGPIVSAASVVDPAIRQPENDDASVPTIRTAPVLHVPEATEITTVRDRGATVYATLHQVKTAEPVQPARLVPGLPRDIETIALKCLRRDPVRRYGSLDQTARLWDVATARPVGGSMQHQGPVMAVAFRPDGKAVLTASGDNTVRIWPIAELPDDFDRVTTWVQLITGLDLDGTGSIQVMDNGKWLERRDKVKQQGRPPLPDAKQ